MTHDPPNPGSSSTTGGPKPPPTRYATGSEAEVHSDPLPGVAVPPRRSTHESMSVEETAPEAVESSGEDEEELEKDPRQGMILAGWRMDVLLDHGPQSNLYAASNQDAERAMVKVLHAELRNDEGIRKRIFREAILARKLSLPGVVKILFNDVTHGGEPFIVCERVVGRSAARLVELAEGPFEENAALSFAVALIDVLDACHQRGVVHRTVHPTNVFLTVDGEVKVLDFGSALVDSELESLDLLTLRSDLHGGVAPELIAHEGAYGDARSDVWSVGALLLTLLTGARVTPAAPSAAWNEGQELEAAFTATAIAYQAVPLDPRHVNARVSAEAAAIVNYATAKSPGDRFPSLVAMRDELVTLLRNRGIDAANLPDRQARLAGILRQFYASRDELENEETGAWRSAEILRTLFRLVENVLYSARRHGWDHAETEVRLSHLVDKVIAAAADDAEGIFWINRPYSFEFRGEAFWQPTAPLDRITYNLFDAGFRKMHLLPGITDEEARTFLRWLTLDPEQDLAIEDDMATKYWGHEFTHVHCDLVSAVVLQDADDYEMLDQELQAMRASAIGQLRSTIQSKLSGNHEAVAADAAQESDEATADYVISRGSLLNLSPVVQKGLGEALFNPIPMWRGRIADVLARAIPNALHVGDIEMVLGPYDQLVEHAFGDEGHFADALEVFGSLAERFDDPRVLARLALPFSQEGRLEKLMRILVPKGQRILYGQELPFLADRVGRLLQHVDGEHMSVVIEAISHSHDRTMLSILLDYVSRNASGHQNMIGELLATAHPLLGSNLIAILTEHLRADSVAALEHAFQSPHPKLRVEAAEVLARYAPRRSYRVLKELIRHDEPNIRQRAVEAIGRNKLMLAAEDLFARLNERGFHQLPVAERKAVMWTVWQIQPDKAEAALCELVTSHGLVANDDLDASRVAAVEVLQDLALSDVALDALATASKKRWWNSTTLRDSATGAHQIVAQRIADIEVTIAQRKSSEDR